MTTKEVRNVLIPNHDYKKKTGLSFMNVYFFIGNEILIGLKKFATLLPNNWLAKTSQTLALMRLGRQSAERERISEINRNIFLEKTVCILAFLRVCLQSETRPFVGFFLFMILHKSGAFRKEDR
ncbi:hypothetical protein J7E52_03870 [Bacillus sp. ISL-34]|uniref:hypothetical protein n=1 Tax=Bacillus sp. ISL-34 TaxID=2819121 RepID=UPI001BEB997D|nr:hypothetical protein [Bacillus sp. ISL-34]MBT2645868.1 hypothetical protein [Bacillus sp. ISL-34]